MFLFPILIVPFLLLNVDPALGKKKQPYYGLTKKDYDCEAVVRIREKQGPDFASKFFFDQREAKRIETCLNKRKDKQEIYYIVKE